MLDVFFAGPHHLDRAIDLLGHAHGRDHHVGFEPAAETATDQVVVDGHFLDREPGRLRRLRLHACHDLRAGPDFASVGLDMNRGVQGLHRRVGKKWQLVRRIQPAAGRKALRDIAGGLGDHAVFLARRAQILPDVIRAEACVRALVPVHHERIEAFFGRPHVIADYRDCIVEHDDLLHARNFLGGAVIDLADLAAEYRTRLQRRELHARQYCVDAVDRLAVDLVGCIEAFQRLADQHEILRVLRRDILWRPLAARVRSQRAIGKLASAFLVDDLAVRGRAACRVDLPLSGGSVDQHGAGAGAGLAQRFPKNAERGRASCRLDAESGIRVQLLVSRGMLKNDRRKIRVQFFGQYHRDRGVDALSHLDLRHDERRLSGAIDADEGVGRELALGHVGRLHRFVCRQRVEREMECEQKTARQAAAQQDAAGNAFGIFLSSRHDPLL